MTKNKLEIISCKQNLTDAQLFGLYIKNDFLSWPDKGHQSPPNVNCTVCLLCLCCPSVYLSQWLHLNGFAPVCLR